MIFYIILLLKEYGDFDPISTNLFGFQNDHFIENICELKSTILFTKSVCRFRFFHTNRIT